MWGFDYLLMCLILLEVNLIVWFLLLYHIVRCTFFSIPFYAFSKIFLGVETILIFLYLLQWNSNKSEPIFNFSQKENPKFCIATSYFFFLYIKL